MARYSIFVLKVSLNASQPTLLQTTSSDSFLPDPYSNSSYWTLVIACCQNWHALSYVIKIERAILNN